MSHLTVCSASVYEHEWRQRWSDCSHFLFLLVFIDLGSRSTSCCGSNQLIFKNPTLMSVNCQKTLGNTCRFFNVYFGNFKQKSILLLQESLHFTRACAGDAFQLAPVYIYSSQPLHSFEGPVIINCISTALKWVIGPCMYPLQLHVWASHLLQGSWQPIYNNRLVQVAGHNHRVRL